jgi:Integrase core domain
MSVLTPTPLPLSEVLEGLLRRLRLPYVRRSASEVLATARAQRWKPAEILRVLLIEEAAGRDQATIQTRRRSSGLPTGKTFDAWEQDASAIPRAIQVISGRQRNAAWSVGGLNTSAATTPRRSPITTCWRPLEVPAMPTTTAWLRVSITDRVWHTRSQLELAIVEYIAWFNNSRLHENLGDRPPREIEELYAVKSTATITTS